jgi:hypothetical protein
MGRLLTARGSQAKSVYQPATTAQASLSGNVLAGAGDPRLNAAFAYLYSAQLQVWGRTQH